jgi:hypothetical protein
VVWTYEQAKLWLAAHGGRIEWDRISDGERVRVRLGEIASEHRTLQGAHVTEVEVEGAVADLVEEIRKRLPQNLMLPSRDRRNRARSNR